MTDQVQEIKERLNIVDVISGYLRLQKAGVNYKANCPFHNEKTPSFMVSPARQVWHCFGCGEGGDVFTFIQKIENIDFGEALKILAEKAGIQLEYVDPKLRSEKERLYEICEKAAQFFSMTLYNPNLQIHSNNTNSNPIIDYLYKRGLKDETIEEWRLGYAPDSWESLLSFLKERGFKESEVEKTGLVLKGGYNKYHDRFRNRLMFPIFDLSGRVVAFSGRMLAEIIPARTEKSDAGKYINSPETVLYNKSRILYGLDKSKNNIRNLNKAVLVEGQMDVLLPWQDGLKNIIATSGTALTQDHLIILKRLTDNLVLAFDMDDAGFKATKKGIDLAASSGFDILVIGLPFGKDPADFVKEKPGEFTKLLDNPEPIMNYYFNQAFKKFDVSKLEGKKIIALNLLSEIKRLIDRVERSNWIRELSLRLGVSEAALNEEMEQIDLETPANNDAAKINGVGLAKTRKEILSERFLALLLKKPELIAEAVKSGSYLPKNDLEILSAFVVNKDNFSSLRSALSPDLRSRLDFLYLASDYEISKAGLHFNIEEEIRFLIKEMEKENYKESLIKIGNEIKKRENMAQLAGKDEDLEELTKEFKNIAEKLNNLTTK